MVWSREAVAVFLSDSSLGGLRSSAPLCLGLRLKHKIYFKHSIIYFFPKKNSFGHRIVVFYVQLYSACS